MAREAMFPLLRYFSITSLVAFILVTGLLSAVYHWTAIDALIRQEERKNVALTQAFANWLWPRFVPYLLATAELPADELRRHPELTHHTQAVLTQVAALPVTKIKIHNLAGTTIFSTAPEQIGEDLRTNSGYLTARAGGVASLLQGFYGRERMRVDQRSIDRMIWMTKNFRVHKPSVSDK